MKLDMHFHSTNSDWLSTTDELVSLAVEKDMDFIALTDHDTVSYWFREKLQEAWILSCQSVEISTKNKEHNKSLHLTMYAREINHDINEKLNDILKGRKLLIKTQIEHLNGLWFNLDLERLYNYISQKWRKIEWINKCDISRFIFSDETNKEIAIKSNNWDEINYEQFYLKFLKEGWDKYGDFWIRIHDYEPLLQDCKTYKEQSNAILSIAHPDFTFKKWWTSQFIDVLPHYIEQWWINAIEINSKATKEWVDAIIEAKNRYNLFLTFWSDCHKVGNPDSKHWDFWEVNPYVSKDFVSDSFDEYREILGV